MNSYRLYPILAFGATAAIIGYALLSRKNKKPAKQLEWERRTDLTRGGRIIDGNVIDVLELEEDTSGQQMILLVYTYDVAGVTYEASQDVTHLRQFIDLYSCRLGLPASVKYDPHNPGRFHRHFRNLVRIAQADHCHAPAAGGKVEYFGVTFALFRV